MPSWAGMPAAASADKNWSSLPSASATGASANPAPVSNTVTSDFMISPAAKPQPPLDRCRRRSKSRPRYWELHRTELTFATYSAIGGLLALEPPVDLVFLLKVCARARYIVAVTMFRPPCSACFTQRDLL